MHWTSGKRNRLCDLLHSFLHLLISCDMHAAYLAAYQFPLDFFRCSLFLHRFQLDCFSLPVGFLLCFTGSLLFWGNYENAYFCAQCLTSRRPWHDVMDILRNPWVYIYSQDFLGRWLTKLSLNRHNTTSMKIYVSSQVLQTYWNFARQGNTMVFALNR